MYLSLDKLMLKNIRKIDQNLRFEAIFGLRLEAKFVV